MLLLLLLQLLSPRWCLMMKNDVGFVMKCQKERYKYNFIGHKTALIGDTEMRGQLQYINFLIFRKKKEANYIASKFYCK